MDAFLVWNARGIGNSETFRHLKYLVHTHKLLFAAILEPIISVDSGYHEYK